MANEEHLKILGRDVNWFDRIADWNTWRKNNSKIRPDLSGARLLGIKLGSRSWNLSPKEFMSGDIGPPPKLISMTQTSPR